MVGERFNASVRWLRYKHYLLRYDLATTVLACCGHSPVFKLSIAEDPGIALRHPAGIYPSARQTFA